MLALGFVGVFGLVLATGLVKIEEAGKIIENKNLNLGFEIEGAHAQSTGVTHENPACFDNYTSWTNSTTFKDEAAWSTHFTAQRPTDGAFINNFERDVNGDGLADYIYTKHLATQITGSNYYYKVWDCVYLSNGNGWDEAYKCVVIKPDQYTGVTYYGDCADV